MFLVQALFFLLFSSLVLGQDFSSETYQRQTALQKANQIINAQYDNLESASFPQPPSSSVVSSYDFIVGPIFNTPTDTLPLFNPTGPEGTAWLPLPKAQAQGVIASAVWTPKLGQSYTGLFGGCQNAIVRLSLTSPPSEAGIVPGFAFKCLKNGVSSANLLAQPTMNYRQKSYNLFANDYSTHPIPQARSDATETEKTILNLYLKSTSYPSMLGLSKFAEVDQSGKRETTPKFPFRLIFHPVDSLHFGIPDTIPTPPSPWYQYLLELNTGPLFEVYAQENPEDQDKTNKYVHIGTISTTRKFIPGKFGDTSLSFEHTFMERDLKFYPQWTAATQKIFNAQLNNATYRYQNLPWDAPKEAPAILEPSEHDDEGKGTNEAGAIALIVFVCLGALVFLFVIGLIVYGLLFDGQLDMISYNEL